MKISMNWLRSFVDFDKTPEEIADIITMLAFECDGIEKYHRYVDGVVVGKVLSAEKHPNADKLQVTKVDVGDEVLDIVCGAANCRKGLLVPVAKVGTKVGDFTIEARKLRGEKSFGMIMSEREIGIAEESNGILELPETFKVGEKLSDYIASDDTVVDFEITVNRPDALSHLGIARELAAKLKLPLKKPDYSIKEANSSIAEQVKVDILASKIGPRYCARLVEGVTVGESPLWMKALLNSVGQRPVNNIVDITNFILFEVGQPLHAFDYDLVKDGHIIVRMAEEKEKIVTLDGKERTLLASDLVIADPEKAIAIAGVMGAANSEVHEDTKNILIEAAYFNPPSVRKTAKHHGLPSEASRRFERGVDPSMPPYAASRCAEMIRTISGGEISKGIVDTYPEKISLIPVEFRAKRAESVLGVPVTNEEAEKFFKSIEFEVDQKDKETLLVKAPTFRHDIEREIDLIEEVIRLKGYDEVPIAKTSSVVLNAPDSTLDRLNDTAVDCMVSMGFREAITSGMTAAKDQETFGGNLGAIGISRPINPEMNAYRASLVPALLRCTEYNINRGIEDIRLFEIGQAGGKGWLGIETNQHSHVAAVITGNSLHHAFDSNVKSFDLSDLKAIVTSLATGLSLDNDIVFSYAIPENLETGVSLLDNKGSVVLLCGLLQEDIAKKFGIEKPVFVLEADLERWIPTDSSKVKTPGLIGQYKKFSRMPAVVRDIAFIVPNSIKAEEVFESLQRVKCPILEDIELFDLYKGKPLEKDQRSLAYRLTFRSENSTLTDKNVEKFINKMIANAQKLDGVALRS